LEQKYNIHQVSKDNVSDKTTLESVRIRPQIEPSDEDAKQVDSDGQSQDETVSEGEAHNLEQSFFENLQFEPDGSAEKIENSEVEQAASRTFSVLTGQAVPKIDTEDGSWELDLSFTPIVGDGIVLGAVRATNLNTESDFLKVRNRGKQSTRKAVIQSTTRLYVDPKACKIWADKILTKRWCSKADIDQIVDQCEGNGDVEELRINIRRIMEIVGFDLDQGDWCGNQVWAPKSNTSSADLAEAIEAALSRATLLPGTKRFLMDKADEQLLIEPLVRAKQELQLEILASEVAVKLILDIFEKIKKGLRSPATVSLRAIIPSRREHSETEKVLAAAEVLETWLVSGRAMDGKRRRQALAALNELDLSLSFQKEMISGLAADNASRSHAIQLEVRVSSFEAANERLILEHLPYARRFAARNVEDGEDPEDVFQAAFLGLQRSTRRFDPELGYRFLIYATFWMQQAVRRWRDDEGATIRIPVHRRETFEKLEAANSKVALGFNNYTSDSKLALELEWPIEQVRVFQSFAREPVSPLSIVAWEEVLPAQAEPDSLDRDDIRTLIATYISTLPERQAEIIRMRFGIGQSSEMTLEEIGQRYGVTRERIRQIEAKALKTLRHFTKLGRFAYLLEG
jgi:RNA polymerase primary sigma factor